MDDMTDSETTDGETTDDEEAGVRRGHCFFLEPSTWYN
ncbi:hypothetical protein VD0002_g7832 [Verticillium dahliae]|uniref:Uncharacterized protein n=1 Tax=Verticillium dahliae TaxID=27337 RepID=A0AA44WS85_VERDA|nr:hypothetical protein BJF96_g565 [Verticillium dahliae]PNH48370.1 hypothetical protein VD0003_g8626 [Verticillium dahliae]PNH59736.1 hypothetical protein VD0002_g7832 [Verticillium dahliae]